MYNGPKVLVFGVMMLFTVVALPVLFSMVIRDLKQAYASTPTSPPAEPAPPMDWTPVMIAAAVVFGVVALIVGIWVAVVNVNEKRAEAWMRAKAARANTRAWKRALDRHDAVKDSYYKYAIDDLDLILRFPALQDVTEGFVEELLEAFHAAADHRPSTINGATDPAGSTYLKAVGELERAWDKALAEATKTASSKLSQKDQRRLKTARQHWTVLHDEAATPSERAINTLRFRKYLDLIELADRRRR